MVRIAQIMKEKLAAAGYETQTAGTFNFVELYAREAAVKSVKKEIPVATEPDSDPVEYASRVYSEAVSGVRETFSKAANDLPIDYHEVTSSVDAILQGIICGNENFISLATGRCDGEVDYLYCHPVNTAILSLTVGMDKKVNMSKLRELGVAAFLHDIGIAKVSDLVNSAERLSAGELEAVRKHPAWGLDTLKRIEGIGDSALRVAYEEHERLDGSGYPHGRVGKEKLCEFSPIVSVVDVFEALTHARPHRAALPAHEAFKKMLRDDEAGKYESDIVRRLISHVGLYPVGSWVKLSNEEVAKVVGINRGYPLKPRVTVIFDHNGWKLKQAKSIDLVSMSAISILRPVSDEELKKYWEKSPS